MSIRERIKSRETRFLNFLYVGYKNIQKAEVPVPRLMTAFFYRERSVRKALWHWLINKMYYEPMVRYCCTSVGKGLRCDGDMPLIVGGGTIILGDNVFIGNQGAWFVSPNLHPNPVLEIGSNTTLNYRTILSVEEKVRIGNHCLIAEGVKIFDNNSHGLDFRDRSMTLNDAKPIYIEDHAWIGMDSIILKGVTIGKGGAVAAGSVVTKDVPEMTLVAGNPARIVKKIDKKGGHVKRSVR